jgi:transcriptional regulator with XRE-family HTH domain
MQDLVVLGQRIRHFRTGRGLTLEQLGTAVGIAGSQLSLMENGRREPRLSLLTSIAHTLGVQLADLLEASAPNERAGLEIELTSMQRSPVYASLGLPVLRPARSMPDDALRVLVGLHRELERKANEAIATPEEARRANTQLRQSMRVVNNYLPDIERVAEQLVRGVGHSVGALTHRSGSSSSTLTTFRIPPGASRTSPTDASICLPPRSPAATGCVRWRCRPWLTACSSTPNRAVTRISCSSASKSTTSPRRA